MEKINFEDKYQKINDYWSPSIIASLNNQDVKLVKIKGEFTWHYHENEDELFFVIKGSFNMELKDKSECWILLFEPNNTLNTGNIINEFTKSSIKNIE
jgi:hypothetical protein